jgi:hypothetical protein
MAMNGIVTNASTANEPSAPSMLHFEIASAPPHFITVLNCMRPPFVIHCSAIDATQLRQADQSPRSTCPDRSSNFRDA